MAKKTKTISIHRISSPVSVGVGNEIIAARIDNKKKDFDTHGCYDNKKGTYVIPVSGIYRIDTITSDNNATHGESKIVQASAGDVINIHSDSRFYNGDYVFIRSNNSLGIFDAEKDLVKIIESSYPRMVGTEINPEYHTVEKVPNGSKLNSILVLYGKKI